jgi:uncharacterized protein
MIIRVSELEEQGLRIDDVAALGEVFTDPAWRLTSVALEIEPDGREVLVHGRLAATMPQTCSRCLEPFAARVDAPVDVRLVPKPTGADSVELGADDLDVDFYDNDELDVTRVVANEATLALPMKPLCRTDCKGLCPQCGTNLNTGSCDCAPAWEDPRLAALKQFKTRES